MSKLTLVSQLISRLEERQRVMLAAASDSAESATGAETRSEGKYDTRAIEAGYLAGAQQAQAEQIASDLAALRRFHPREFSLDDPIALGALVEADVEGETEFYLLSPAAGGETLEFIGCEVTVLAPDAPLYQQLLGATAGSALGDPPLLILGVE